MTWRRARRSACFVVLPAVCLCLGGAGFASGRGVDDLELRLLEGAELPLRWDNVEGPPLLVSGPLPQRVRRVGAHLVKLDSRSGVTVRLEPGVMLRVHSPFGPVEADALEVSVSDGSGLWVEAEPRRAESGDLLVLQPGAGHALLGRVTRPAGRGTAIEVALYTSRREPLGPLARYRRAVALGGTRLEVRRDRGSAGAPFWRVEPGVPARVTLRGPTRLAVETRLLYPQSESQAFQGYRVHARLDDASLPTLDYETTLDPLPISVDGRQRALGRLETAYLDVPPGRHVLELDPTVALAARLFARESDYLLPDLNQDPPEGEGVGRSPTPTPAAHSRFELTEDEARRIASTGPRGAGRIHRLALRLVRENSRPDGGLVAASLVAATAASRPDAPWLRDVAESLRSAHTFYRDLLPVAKQDPGPQRVGWFVARRLRTLGERSGAVAVSESLLENPPEGLSRGIFLGVPEGPARAQRYPLPCRHAPSWLRVVVERVSDSATGELFLQIGEEPPVRLLIRPGPERPVEEYRPSGADAALTALGRRGRALAAGPLMAVGTAELPLPAAAQEVRLWRDASGPAPFRVALQYRASRPYRLSESEYRDLVRRAGGEAAVRSAFLAATSGQGPAEAEVSEAIWELRNHWDPLLRLLATRDRVFAGSVAPSPGASASGRPNLATDVTAVAEEARALAARGEWLPALEAWGGVYFSSGGAARREAAFGRVTALEELGESFLAELQLRGLFLHDPDPQTRDEAFARLSRLYARAEDREGLGLLLAAAARRAPTPETLAALLDALLEEGEPDLALMVGLALGPAAEVPPASLVRAAVGARWWAAFEGALPRLTAVEQSYWKGERLLAQGDPEGAVALFTEGGEPGRAVAAYLEQGTDVRRRLGSKDAEQRAEAVFDWERWLAGDPRPRIWREAEALVVDHAGGDLTCAAECGPTVRHFRATPARPVRLEVIGPLRLRIEARPLHAADATRPFDDWLRVVADDQLEIVPINANRPSPDLRLVGDATQRPGQRVEASLDLGPGRHEIATSAGRLPVLVRVLVERPENPAGLLPELAPSALAAFVEGPEDLDPVLPPWGSVLILPLGDRAPVSEPLRPPAATPVAAGRVVPMSGLAPLTEARIALRLGTPLASEATWVLADGFAEAEAVSPRERLLALTRLGDSRAACPSLLRSDLGLSERARQARCLAEGRIDDALAMPPGEAPEDVIRRLSLLLKLSEERPEEAARAQALGDALFFEHAHLEPAQAIYARLVRDSAWLPAPSPTSSAGVRPIELPAGSPEDPRGRVQRALLPPVLPEEQILAGGGRLALSFSNQAAAEVELALERQDLEYLPPMPLTAWHQLDEGPEQRIRLTPEAPRQVLRLTVPSGRHVLRIGISDPLVNQFLRVSARERRSTVWVPILDRVARSYHLATPEEPFRIDLAGPAWVRVDERRGERTLTHYAAVPAAGRSLEIRPEAGREVLLRLFHRAPEAATGSSLLLRPQRGGPGPEPPPLLQVQDGPQRGRLRLEDALPLGRQEDPTWSASSAFVSRILFDEDAAGRQPAQEFVELRLGRRFSHLGRHRYDRTDLLARVNAQGGPTVGLLQQVHHHTGASRVFRADASAYLQTGGGSGAPGAGGHWSLSLGGEVSQRWWFGPKTYHTPSLGLFGRVLSLAADAGLDPAEVDRDVFTRYKARHRAGLVLSDTVTHAPWLDAEAWGTVALVSNETILDRPDHFSLEGGWRQKIGALLLAGEYRAARFLAGQDRGRAVTRQALSLELGVETWHRNRQRIELDFRYRYHLRERRSSAGLFLNWYPDHGRGFRDFAPRSLEFRELRERRAARTVNNRLWEEP